MDVRGILKAMKAQRANVDKAITALTSTSDRSKGTMRTKGVRRRRRGLSAASKRRISLSMRKAWAHRKKKTAEA